MTIFQAVHDMTHPVEALETARRLLAEGGALIVADERVADAFGAPTEDPMERLALRLQRPALPAGRPRGRTTPPRPGRSCARTRSRRTPLEAGFEPRRGPADRERLLALLPAQPTAVSWATSASIVPRFGRAR